MPVGPQRVISVVGGTMYCCMYLQLAVGSTVKSCSGNKRSVRVLDLSESVVVVPYI